MDVLEEMLSCFGDRHGDRVPGEEREDGGSWSDEFRLKFSIFDRRSRD